MVGKKKMVAFFFLIYIGMLHRLFVAFKVLSFGRTVFVSLELGVRCPDLGKPGGSLITYVSSLKGTGTWRHPGTIN